MHFIQMKTALRPRILPAGLGVGVAAEAKKGHKESRYPWE